jgi:hypothetical protein
MITDVMREELTRMLDDLDLVTEHTPLDERAGALWRLVLLLNRCGAPIEVRMHEETRQFAFTATRGAFVLWLMENELTDDQVAQVWCLLDPDLPELLNDLDDDEEETE